jgi:hypothetical protein
MGNSQGQSGGGSSNEALTNRIQAKLISVVNNQVPVSEDDLKDCKMLNEIYKILSGGVSGGSVLGGYDALQDYGNSLFSKAKEKLIRDIASSVYKALKLKGADKVRTEPLSKVLDALKKFTPNPKKYGNKYSESLNKSSSNQKHVCMALADAINSNYGGNIINLNSSPNDMCNQVAEVMYSLFTGLHTEFINVAGDVSRVMKNMQTVSEALDAAYRKQVELVSRSGDQRLKDQSDNSAKLYSELKGEYERQSAVLANLMNVSIGPTGKALITSLEENRDFAGLVKDLKAETGTTAFGDKLANLLSGVSSVAHSAELVNKALNKIGMSVSEFKGAKNAADLRMRVYNHIMKDEPTSKELDEMMAAAQIIYNNSYDHDSIAKLLDKSKRGGDEEDDSYEGGGDKEDDFVLGGDEDDGLAPYWAKKSLSKKLANKEKYRNLVLKDFRKLLRGYYQTIVESANAISSKIGNEIPVSDNLDAFVKAFAQIQSLDEEKLHIALSGYAKDINSKEKRERFMNDYVLLIDTIDPLLKGPGGSYFKDIKSSITLLLKAIDDFSEKMVKAITEIHIDRPDQIQDALKKTASAFYGGGDSGDDTFGTGSWVSFPKVQMEMKYALSIADIKTNMSRMANEVTDYGADYEQLLGEEAGWLINTIKEEYINLIDACDSTKLAVTYGKPTGSNMTTETENKLKTIRIALSTSAKKEETAKRLAKLLTEQMNAKVNMVKVAQAVDLYLKAFANGIAKNPDSVSSVVKMLDQVEIVARWFNEKSGDNLAFLFECFPSSAEGGDKRTYSGKTPVLAPTDDSIKIPQIDSNGTGIKHYYEWLESSTELPGNPFIGRPLDDFTDKGFDSLLGLSEKVIKSMRALENILSAFSSVGSKFGDLSPQSQTFMTPGQMFNHLCNYIKYSTFTTQFAPSVIVVNAGTVENKAQDITAALYKGKITEPKTKNHDLTVLTDIPENNPDKRRLALTDIDIGVANIASFQSSQRLSEIQSISLSGKPEKIDEKKDGNGHAILTGVSNKAVNNADAKYKYTCIAMSAIPAEGEYTSTTGASVNEWNYHDYSNREKDRLDRAGWQDAFYDTDLLFEMVIKSIVCKVFTVVDAYRLFHRPTIGRQYTYSLNPLRTIIGGSEGGAIQNMVKIIPEAIELYFRLPLLAEWYREMFGLNAGKKTDFMNGDWRLSIVPSVDGLWSEFISIIFEQVEYVKEGNYTESQVQRMLEEMNKIFKVYKSKYPKATVRNIINAFIMEINRVFGFLKQTEIEKYLQQKRDYLTNNGAAGDSKEDFLDYDILDANDQFADRPAPSDKFINFNLKDKDKTKRNRLYMQKFVDQMRRSMDVEFLKYTNEKPDDPNNYTNFSFVETLKNYKKEVDNCKTELESYKTVLRMVQGANKYIHASYDKLIMVHEAVAAPLAALYAVYKVLAKYNALLHGASIVNFEKWNARRAAAGVAVGTPTGVPAELQIGSRTAANTVEMNKEYKEFLASTEEYKIALNGKDNTQLELFARVMCGDNNNPRGYINTGAAANVTWKNNEIDGWKILRDTFSAILDLTSSDSTLVSCSVGNNGNINVDYSRLQDLCTTTLEQIKTNIRKLRPSFAAKDTEIVDKYEDSKSVGSTRWLEENMVQILFNNRDKTGLESAHTGHLQQTIQKLSDPTSGVAGVGKYGTMDNALRSLIFYTYETAKSSLPEKVIRNDVKTFPFNVIQFRLNPDSQEMKTAVTQLQSKAELDDVKTMNAANAILKVPIIGFEDEDTINNFNLVSNSKSLMLAFNKILHMYLYLNTDDGTRKFYAPLVETFANSAGSKEVLQGKAFPNISTIVNTFLPNAKSTVVNEQKSYTAHLLADGNPLNGPPTNTVIFASVAVTVKSLLQTTQVIGTSQKKLHLYENFTEIPEYMKERMKVNLPYFSKILQNFYSRADTLKKLLNYTQVKTNIKSANAGATGVNTRANGVLPVVELVDDMVDLKNYETNAMTTYFNGLLDRLIECSASLKKCCDGVYKELNDKVPYFFETSKDFITDYKQRVGHLPLMPASSILSVLTAQEGDFHKWTSLDSSHLLMPVRENGSSVYKFNYGSRAVLSRNDVDPQLEHFPGAKEIYNNYASREGNALSVSSGEYSSTIKSMVRLTRFLADGSVYGRLYDKSDHSYQLNYGGYRSTSVFNDVRWRDTVPTSKVNVHTASGEELAKKPNVKDKTSQAWKDLHANLSVFALSNLNGLSGVIDLTENTGLEASKEKFANSLGVATGDVKGTEREKLRVHNILDMNVVPINVHAFMREIPFVNLLNYAYTFDRMIHEFTLPTYISNMQKSGTAITADNLMIKAGADINSTRELLVKLLCHPWADLGAGGKQYFALCASLFNGNDNLKLGRPRYLSDQLWHKALLTSSAQLVARQAAFNGNNSSFDVNMKSLESGPAAYEAVRAVVRYAGPSTDETDSMHKHIRGSDEDLNFRNICKFELFRNFKTIAAPAPSDNHIDEFINNKPLTGADVSRDIKKILDKILVQNFITSLKADVTALHTSTIAKFDTYFASVVNENMLVKMADDIRAACASNKYGRDVLVYLSKTTAPSAANVLDEVKEHSTALANLKARNNIQHLISANGAGKNIDTLFRTVDVSDAKHENSTDLSLEMIDDHLFITTEVKEKLSAVITNKLVVSNGVADIVGSMFALVAMNSLKLNKNLTGKELKDNFLLINDYYGGDYAQPKGTVPPLNLIPTDQIVLSDGTNDAEIKTCVDEHDALATLAYKTILRVISNNYKIFMIKQFVNILNISNDGKKYFINYLCDALLRLKPQIRPSELIKDVAALSLDTKNPDQGNRYTSLAMHQTISGGDTLENILDSSEIYKYITGYTQIIVNSIHNISVSTRTANMTAPGINLHLELPSDPVTTRGLKYFDHEKKTWSVSTGTNMSIANVLYCAELGKMRFDTKLVRNLSWLVQLQRVMRVILINHLSWLNTPVVRGLKIADPKVTEYESNDQFDESDYTGANYEAL